MQPTPASSTTKKKKKRGHRCTSPDFASSLLTAFRVVSLSTCGHRKVGRPSQSTSNHKKSLTPQIPPPDHIHTPTWARTRNTQEKLPPPPPAPPLEAPWKPPPPGFDARTLRRQASALRGEASAAHRDEETVRRSSLRLAELLRGTVENGRENVFLARERLRCLHAALRRLRGERARHGKAVEAAVAWQESLEELRHVPMWNGKKVRGGYGLGYVGSVP